MTAEKFKRKLTAILSADVKGYSRLMGADEEATLRTLQEHKEVMGSSIQHHRGRIVGTAGNTVLAEFERDIIRHRVRAGLENAKRNRPPRNAIVCLREGQGTQRAGPLFPEKSQNSRPSRSNHPGPV